MRKCCEQSAEGGGGAYDHYDSYGGEEHDANDDSDTGDGDVDDYG